MDIGPIKNAEDETVMFIVNFCFASLCATIMISQFVSCEKRRQELNSELLKTGCTEAQKPTV